MHTLDTASSLTKGPIVYDQIDDLHSALPGSILSWKMRTNPGVRISTRVITRYLDGIRLVDYRSGRCRGQRGAAEIARDDRAYMGVLFHLDGSEICDNGKQKFLVKPGDIAVWHSEEHLQFEVVEPVHKLVLLVPEERMESVLPNPARFAGTYMPVGSGAGGLVAAFMRALADNSAALNGEGARPAMELTLGLLGSAIIATSEQLAAGGRSTLVERVLKFIDLRLDDPDLSPTLIAQAHSISLRYLHLLFADRGESICSWIRERRLAHCRAELARESSAAVAEIAFRWGFSDAAHFSRTFKARYGVSPKAFRDR